MRKPIQFSRARAIKVKSNKINSKNRLKYIKSNQIRVGPWTAPVPDTREISFAMGSRGLVSASWLLGNLGRAGVKVVDASYSMPANDHFELFQRERIPGAGVAGAP